MNPITLPADARMNSHFVIGIMPKDTSPDHRIVYLYFDSTDGARLRSEFKHSPLDGNVLWTVGRVADAITARNPDATISVSSSVDFPEE